MMLFRYDMRTKGKLVASGIASSSLTYEFQKVFIEFIGPGSEQVTGSFLTLDQLIGFEVRDTYKWETISSDVKLYTFEVERIA